ncbi:hypothetical protein F444_07244, partial [Phytophthora nicotianae P1976]
MALIAYFLVVTSMRGFVNVYSNFSIVIAWLRNYIDVELTATSL